MRDGRREPDASGRGRLEVWLSQALLALVGSILVSLVPGCATINGDLFPNAPQGSFINTPALGPGPVIPTQPVSGHTFSNPTGRSGS